MLARRCVCSSGRNTTGHGSPVGAEAELTQWLTRFDSHRIKERISANLTHIKVKSVPVMERETLQKSCEPWRVFATGFTDAPSCTLRAATASSPWPPPRRTPRLARRNSEDAESRPRRPSVESVGSSHELQLESDRDRARFEPTEHGPGSPHSRKGSSPLAASARGRVTPGFTQSRSHETTKRALQGTSRDRRPARDGALVSRVLRPRGI